MGNTDFAEIADDRINTQLDFDVINSEDDYRREVRNLLISSKHKSSRNLLPFIDELYNESKAKDLVEKKISQRVKDEEDAFRKALAIHRRRSLNAQLVDERRTSKRTSVASRLSVSRWRRNPSLRDIRGVDTRLLRRNRVPVLITRAKETELLKKGVGVGFDKRGFRHFRDVKTGRFTRRRV